MTVNIIYIVAQAINGIRRILVVILTKSQVTVCEKPYSYFYVISVSCLSFNAAANFFIFVLYNKHFRRLVKKIWLKSHICQNKISPDTLDEGESRRNQGITDYSITAGEVYYNNP